eukprot:GHVN01084531.1.p1 GENE.GHVN01084531.1~~GHVN01084531.1.p1  ORF type:complete len:136 (-),score=15.55 GHVN01084531.1:610-1017(-)
MASRVFPLDTGSYLVPSFTTLRYIDVDEDGSSDGTATPVQQPELPQAGRSAISPSLLLQYCIGLHPWTTHFTQGFAPSEEDIENIRESDSFSGVLPKQAVSHLLTTFGEPLTPECVSTALKDQPDPVPYRDFVQL